MYRPADAQRFNGTAVVCWNNVTAGYELFGGESPEFLDGYAVVAATVQRVGVTGFPTNSQGLAAWDPERYGTPEHPDRRCVLRHLHPGRPSRRARIETGPASIRSAGWTSSG